MLSDENRVAVESWLTLAVVLALQCSNFKNVVDSFLA